MWRPSRRFASLVSQLMSMIKQLGEAVDNFIFSGSFNISNSDGFQNGRVEGYGENVWRNDGQTTE